MILIICFSAHIEEKISKKRRRVLDDDDDDDQRGNDSILKSHLDFPSNQPCSIAAFVNS